MFNGTRRPRKEDIWLTVSIALTLNLIISNTTAGIVKSVFAVAKKDCWIEDGEDCEEYDEGGSFY